MFSLASASKHLGAPRPRGERMPHAHDGHLGQILHRADVVRRAKIAAVLDQQVARARLPVALAHRERQISAPLGRKACTMVVHAHSCISQGPEHLGVNAGGIGDANHG